jgi:hypothetical protein
MTLYELLMDLQKSCKSEEHTALLQLSGFNWNTPKEKLVFDMLLSTCSQPPEDAWHEATCTLELFVMALHRKRCTSLTQWSHFRQEPGRDDDVADICYELNFVRTYQTPLCVSFTISRRLWTDTESMSFESRRRSLPQTPNRVNLDFLLQEGLLKTEDSHTRVRKSNLALLLASSLLKLYPGPWIRENLSADLVQFLSDQTTKRIEMLDQPYIPCTFVRNWRESNAVFRSWQQHVSSKDKNSQHMESQRYIEKCPAFFLSFAQLLVDIEKGERGGPPFLTDTNRWYDSLSNELNQTFQDGVSMWYRKAIRGCLDYSLDYKLWARRIEDPRERAEAIIRENIVLQLQENLRVWEEQWGQEMKGESSSSQLSGAGSTSGGGEGSEGASSRHAPPKVASRPHDTADSRNRSAPLSQVRDRPSCTAEFTLFADSDENYEEYKRFACPNLPLRAKIVDIVNSN